MPLPDIRIPADASDQQTTDAKSALPPFEFQVTNNGTANLVTIHDRQAVQNRAPTASYRVYFLPKAFAPNAEVAKTKIRAAGRKVASLVTDVSAPSLGTLLNYSDTDNNTQDGYYYCVGVNRAGIEAPPEHIVFVPGTGTAATKPNAAASSGGGISPIIFTPTMDTTTAGTITGPVNGINTAFTMTTTFGTLDLVFVDGILDLAAAAIGVALTVSTPPVSDVAVEHVA